jgi:RNA polymerase sigma-70 factor, ECF subfamily
MAGERRSSYAWLALDDPDAPLVERLRRGDSSAMTGLVQRHRAALERLAGRYVRNEADAADVAQEAFERALRNIGSFRGDAPFRSWLLRIAVNLALNRLRASTLLEPLELADDATFATSLGTTHLVAAEVWRRVAERIGELPPKQRAVVELRLFHELSFEEIGGIVGCSEDSAKTNFHHGLKRLRGLVPAP